MIIDTEPPDAPRRRWPFLAGWCGAAITIVLALFLTHEPLSHQPPVATTTSPTPPASVPGNVIVEQLPVGVYTTVQRIDGRGLPSYWTTHVLIGDARDLTTILR